MGNGIGSGRAALALGIAIGAMAAFPVSGAATTINEYDIPTSSSFPYVISAGPDGNLWFTEFCGNKIGRVTTSGVITEFPVPTASSGPLGITAGPDGNLWFTEALGSCSSSQLTGNSIGRITTAGVIMEFPIPTADSNPTGIASGADGALWFTEFRANKIGRLTLDGSFTEFPIPTAKSEPLQIVAGSDGNLWFTEISGSIGRITTDGVISEFPVPSANSFPNGIAAGPDGNLWFTERFANKIGRITTDGVITEFPSPTSPVDIAAGADGNLWFTLFADEIGRISTAGVVSVFPLPTSNDPPEGIAAGADGNLWFTQLFGNQIGSIGADTTPPTLTLPNNIRVSATSSAGVVVSYTVTATDPDNSPSELLISCSPASGSTFPLGETTVNCGASDPAGNTTSGHFTVTVVDTTAPTLVLPGDINVTATSSSGAIVTYTVTATDPDDDVSQLVISCSPRSGSTFPPGTTTVSCTASDPSGNDASGSFTVTVMIPTVTALASSLNPVQVGQPVTYTATVSPTPTGGSVSFTDNGSPVPGCSAVPLSGANASCTVLYGSAVSHTLLATYSGSGTYTGSASSGLTEVVARVACTTLAGCNLHGTTLTNGNLAGANLSGANLNGANLSGANLSGANLSGANLANANLTGANLSGAITTGANFSRATWSNTVCPDGTNSDSDGGTCVGHF